MRVCVCMRVAPLDLKGGFYVTPERRRRGGRRQEGGARNTCGRRRSAAAQLRRAERRGAVREETGEPSVRQELEERTPTNPPLWLLEK